MLRPRLFIGECEAYHCKRHDNTVGVSACVDNPPFEGRAWVG